MITNFFKIAFRFLWRNKTYSLLNFFCLTFGLTCAIVASLNINRIISYDRFHKNYNRLYQVVADVTYFNGDRFPRENLSASLTGMIRQDIPEIELLSRVVVSNHLFANGNESFSETGIYADQSFLDMFSFPLAGGDPAGALRQNNSIVISEKMATKFFRSTDCLGKTLMLKNDTIQEGFTVTGILKNLTAPSNLRFDFIIPFSKFMTGNSQAAEAGASACQVWALLLESADRGMVNGKLKNLIKQQDATLNQELFLFPLKEKMLYYYIGGRRVWGEMRNIVITGCLGLAILLISCFNFINLAIAQNMKRYREAGIKKVLGAQKSSIIMQHLGETFILTLISFFTATELVRVVVMGLNRAFNGDVQFSFNDYRTILIFAGITIFTATVSGVLPSLYISSSNPVNILKGKLVTSHSFSSFRQSLIVFQFTIPVVLIICMIIVKAQDAFLRNYDLGFDKNGLMIVPNSGEINTHSESVRADLLSIPGIESVSFSNCIPARGTRMSNEVSWEGKDAAEKFHFWCINTDYSYDETVNIKMSDGRYFDMSYPSDSGSFVINDIAAKVMGYENPVGKTMTLDNKKGTIIGVFTDFRVILSGPPVPVVISMGKEDRNNLLIKFTPGDYSAFSGKIKTALSKYEPDKTIQPLLYRDLMSRTELTTVSNLAGVAFFISILLACLGLLGLTSFTTASRTKEIGIRKINGASILSLMRLLGLKYSKWLTIASVIAIPVAFLIGNLFLARFSLRTPVPYWAFLAGPAIAYIIALSTFVWQCWKASTRNPAEALRYE